MEKLTKVILNELNEWDLSCSEESTLKLELAKALTRVVKNCNLHSVMGSAARNELYQKRLEYEYQIDNYPYKSEKRIKMESKFDAIYEAECILKKHYP